MQRNKTKNSEIEEPHLPGTLRRQGYEWLEENIDSIANEIVSKLHSMEAKGWRIDVYASTNKIYRNYTIRYKLDGQIRDITVMFELDKPSRISTKS